MLLVLKIEQRYEKNKDLAIDYPTSIISNYHIYIYPTIRFISVKPVSHLWDQPCVPYYLVSVPKIMQITISIKVS